jgi:hypothetical protein
MESSPTAPPKAWVVKGGEDVPAEARPAVRHDRDRRRDLADHDIVGAQDIHPAAVLLGCRLGNVSLKTIGLRVR